MRRRLLDLMCCEGIGAEGYVRAGWDVTGVDTDKARGRYYPGTFVHGDALAYAAAHAHEFDAVHASPNCQPHSQSKHTHNAHHDDNLTETVELLRAIGVPWVVENVPGARALMPGAVELCGAAFGGTARDANGRRLVLRRHRLFMSSEFIPAHPCLCAEAKAQGFRVAGVYGAGSTTEEQAKARGGGYTPADKASAAALIGTTREHTWQGLRQSLPPAMTEHVGTWLALALDAVAA